MKPPTKHKPKPITGIIPSQNAIRYCYHQLSTMQHRAMKDAMAMKYCDDIASAKALELQADDMRQVAQFLEERLLRSPVSRSV